MNTDRTREESEAGGAEASASRLPGVGEPTGARPRAARAQVRAVGASFLRLRPLVVAPVALVQAALLASSGAPRGQRVALGVALGAALALFSAEALALGRRGARGERGVGERWLGVSLGATLLGLAAACALSGGLASPFTPLLAAPLVVAFAAFGRSRGTARMLALALAAAAALAIAENGGALPFPRLPEEKARWMHLTAFAGAAALAYAGVAGLVEAHARAADLLDRMRLATLEEAASRMRATEQVGAKVAHELKNPLAAVRALVQLVLQGAGGAGNARRVKRLEVALGELDRMDSIVRDYLAFSRPLSDLRPEPVDALGIARDVVAVLEARAEGSGIALSAEGEPCPLVADGRRLREALLNLADNALAATPAGGRVVLRAAPRPSGAEIVIEDTGSGLAPEIARAPGSAFVTTKEEGTGLGLVLARGSRRPPRPPRRAIRPPASASGSRPSRGPSSPRPWPPRGATVPRLPVGSAFPASPSSTE